MGGLRVSLNGAIFMPPLELSNHKPSLPLHYILYTTIPLGFPRSPPTAHTFLIYLLDFQSFTHSHFKEVR